MCTVLYCIGDCYVLFTACCSLAGLAQELRDRVAEILSVPPQQLTLRDLEKMVSMGTKDRRKALGCSS